MMLESLESRLFLSASAVNAQIHADRAQIHADLLQFKADMASYTTTIMTDAKAIKNDAGSSLSTIQPLFKTLKTDVNNMHLQLEADLLAESSAVKADQATIITDTQQFAADKGHPTARRADLAKILADRIKLQNDEIAGLNARIATRKSFDTQLSTDMNAIITAVQNDPNASSQLKADVQKFTTDRTNSLSTFESDLTKIKTDRAKLVTDLTALQNQAPLV